MSNMASSNSPHTPARSSAQRTIAESTLKSKLPKALAKAQFRVFHLVEELGCFTWTPYGSFKETEHLQASDISKGITIDVDPPVAVPARDLNRALPLDFIPHNEETLQQRFPYDSSAIAKLHALALKRPSKLDGIHFVLGGTALGFLAAASPRRTQKSSVYLAALVPGTRIVFVRLFLQHPSNADDSGFQVQRFVMGGNFNDIASNETLYHHQIMDVGGAHRVLLFAKVNGVDSQGHFVKVRSSRPKMWGTKLPMQMISAGSSKLFAAETSGPNSGDKLLRMRELSFAQITGRWPSVDIIRNLERNTLAALEKLNEFVAEGKIKEGWAESALTFRNQELILKPLDDPICLFPSAEVVEALCK